MIEPLTASTSTPDIKKGLTLKVLKAYVRILDFLNALLTLLTLLPNSAAHLSHLSCGSNEKVRKEFMPNAGKQAMQPNRGGRGAG